jgi:hypothetical protein
MSLLDEVDAGRIDIRTDSYPMSIGEWVTMYEASELDIHPEFQRFFRWTDAQKSALIESILLGIPIPPIFVSQRKDGVWDVIDGLQRLSSIFQLLGIFKDHKGVKLAPLILNRTKFLPSLEGKSWEGDDALPIELQRIIRRSKIDVSILLRESDQATKYHLFQRLNQGGTKLTEQEVRNCILVSLKQDFYEWIEKLSEDENFKTITALSDKSIQEAYDVELVVRFLLLVDAQDEQLARVGDVGSFLTDEVTKLASLESFDRGHWERKFTNVCRVLADEVGENAFRRYSIAKKRHEGGFAISQFEAVTAGVAARLDAELPMAVISERIKSLWDEEEFTDMTRSGVTAARRLKRIIPFARRHFMQ